jgi:hypothetical protein
MMMIMTMTTTTTIPFASLKLLDDDDDDDDDKDAGQCHGDSSSVSEHSTSVPFGELCESEYEYEL